MTACSALFFDHYIDLLDSLTAVGLDGRFEIGVLDLGLTAEQLTVLEQRGAHCVAGSWPITPPENYQQAHLVAFAGKPFARNYFPGYDNYVWMDADLWVQSTVFWRDLIDGVSATGAAVPIERHGSYRSMPLRERAWMWRHLSHTYGVLTGTCLLTVPMINNGLFALHADAPHWDLWQKRFKQMVSCTGRVIAIDQLAFLAMMHLDKPDVSLLDATNNWVCSLSVPVWDARRRKYVAPDAQRETLSVVHITTPSRDVAWPVKSVSGKVEARFLHRPGGKVLAAMGADASGLVSPLQSPTPASVPTTAAAPVQDRRRALESNDS